MNRTRAATAILNSGLLALLLMVTAVDSAVAAVVVGTDGNDVLGGTQQRDTMRGYRGHDLLAGYDSRDHIYGGLGRDRLRGGGGSDFIYGGGANDALFGDHGDDRLVSGAGSDAINAGFGDDIIWVYGDGAIDSVRCGRGVDVVYRDADDIVGDACETSIVAVHACGALPLGRRLLLRSRSTRRVPNMPEQPTLVIVDVQRAFDDPYWGNRNNPGAEENVARLLAAWRAAGAPIIHVRHLEPDPDPQWRFFHDGDPGFEFKPEAMPLAGEPVVTKGVNSAFIGTDLEERLRAAGTTTVVIAGITTDHCGSTTARMSGNLGFETWMVGDACATFDREGPGGEVFPAELIHRTALASLNGEFADVVSTDEAIARLG